MLTVVYSIYSQPRETSYCI